MKNDKAIFFGFIGGIAFALTINSVLTAASLNAQITEQVQSYAESAPLIISSQAPQLAKSCIEKQPVAELLNELELQTSWLESIDYLAEYTADDITQIKTQEQALNYLISYFSNTTNPKQQRIDALLNAELLQPDILNANIIESLLMFLTEMDESSHNDQIIQTLNLLEDNIEPHSLEQIVSFLQADDADIRATTLRVIGRNDIYRQYYDQVVEIKNTDNSAIVSKAAYFVLSRYEKRF
ncbi:MAG: hypothetical protein HRT35_37420 [Algicola sp.]|nr:hypothetical protein [Algicola sp.]